MLFFRFPVDRRRTKKNKVASDGRTGDRTTNLVGVKVSKHLHRGINAKKNTLTRSTFKKINNLKCGILMLRVRGLHEVSQHMNNIRNIRASTLISL